MELKAVLITIFFFIGLVCGIYVLGSVIDKKKIDIRLFSVFIVSALLCVWLYLPYNNFNKYKELGYFTNIPDNLTLKEKWKLVDLVKEIRAEEKADIERMQKELLNEKYINRQNIRNNILKEVKHVNINDCF